MIFIFWQIDGSFQCLHVNPMLQRKHVMLPLIVREVFWLDRRLSTRSRSAPNGVTIFKIVVTFYGAQMFHSVLDSPKSVLKYPAQPLSIFMIWTHANILMPRTNWRMTVVFRMPRKFFYYFIFKLSHAAQLELERHVLTLTVHPEEFHTHSLQ